MPFETEVLTPYSYPPLVSKASQKAAYVYEHFPLGIHNDNGRNRTVNNQEELDAALAGGWHLGSYVEPPKAEEIDTCPNCTRMEKRFQAAWQKLSKEADDLEARNAALQESLAAAENTIVELQQKIAEPEQADAGKGKAAKK